ncbi:hypothetical protein GCM10010124_19020 [Pilimelia terevasa]|uniref:Nucleotidyl transferase domain-containing protein n=1 Tax=Pilimelia terevasa TaxID=53372 RepID=A0A8J3FHM4_9ACTN|nr:sugar phosphate nucleotidyltransferase [Pilimelia terevasa]GGK26540.1 hypothetical protein GCM10010124_19020 [Pilimelia terevasa]
MIAAVVLAAGLGTRLRPLTDGTPKALCPVGNVPLLDLALARLARCGLAGPDSVAVNASYLGAQVAAHVAGRATVSWETAGPLGTAGALGALRDWLDGRDVLVGNADAYLVAAGPPVDADGGPREDADGPPEGTDGGGADIAPLLADWSGATVRLLARPAAPGEPGEFGAWRFAGFSLVPWRLVRDLAAEPAELWREVWRPAEAGGTLECVPYSGTYLDCGTPAAYLAANLHAARQAGGRIVSPDALVTGAVCDSVVGAGAAVHGRATRCVVWPGATVPAGESLSDAVRLPHTTVQEAPPRSG